MPDKEDVAVAEVVEETAVATVDAGLLERLASNPDVDVDKLERMVALMETQQDREAERLFNVAFVQMQPELPAVERKGRGQHQNEYAFFEDIQKEITPVLQRHGFALSFRPEPTGNEVMVTAILLHEAGHSREASFVGPADKGQGMNEIQGRASTQSYGMRYATRAVLNLRTKGEDDDGNSAGAPEPPDGYEDWLMDMEVLAEEGTKRLHETWKVSDPEFRRHLTTHNPAGWNAIKDAARKVGA